MHRLPKPGALNPVRGERNSPFDRLLQDTSTHNPILGNSIRPPPTILGLPPQEPLSPPVNEPPSSLCLNAPESFPEIGVVCDCFKVSNSDPETACNLLKFFGLRYDRQLGFLVCPSHNTLVLPKSLGPHLLKHATLADGQVKKAKRESIVRHILVACAIPRDQKPPPRATWVLPRPNPYLGEIIEARKCPLCALPFDQRSSMAKHIGKLHPQSKKWRKPSRWQDLPKVDTQWAFRTTPDKKYLYKVNSRSPITPPTSTAHDLGTLPPIPLSSGPIIPHFYQTLYWTHWMDKIKGNDAWTSSLMKAVFGLVELPSAAKIKKAASDSERARLETGLLRVHQILRSYLLSADTWLSSYHHSLREKLKARSGHIALDLLNPLGFRADQVVCSSKSPFKRLAPSTITYYRYPLTVTVCLMVRTEYLSRQNKKPRGISIPITPAQQEARDNMIQALLTDPQVDDQVLTQAVHRLCSSLLMVSLSDVPQLGFAFELALCIYAHRLFLNASQVSQLFAGMQSCFRLTLAHVIRLENQGESVYVDPPASPPQSQGNTTPASQSTIGEGVP
jgi:hypothetical protein